MLSAEPMDGSRSQRGGHDVEAKAAVSRPRVAIVASVVSCRQEGEWVEEHLGVVDHACAVIYICHTRSVLLYRHTDTQTQAFLCFSIQGTLLMSATPFLLIPA